MATNFLIVIENSPEMSSNYKEGVTHSEYAKHMAAEFLQQEIITNKKNQVAVLTRSDDVSENNLEIIVPFSPIKASSVNTLIQYKFMRTCKYNLNLIENSINYIKNMYKPKELIKLLFFGSFDPKITTLVHRLDEVNLITPFLVDSHPMLNIFDFDEFAKKLKFIVFPEKKPVFWNCNLEIGAHLSIPIKSCVLTKKSSNLKVIYGTSDCEPFLGAPSPLKRRTVHLQPGTDEPVDDVCNAYYYGGSLVGFTHVDEENARISSEKSLKFLGFTKTSNVHRSYWTGDSVSLVMAHGNLAFSALVKGCAECDVVCIVRRVFSRACCPRIGFLMPRLPDMFYWSELAFTEDVKPVAFGSLPIMSPKSPESLTAVDALIDSFDLMKRNDPILEELPLNYSTQRVLRNVQNKMFPGRYSFEDDNEMDFIVDRELEDLMRSHFPNLT